MGKYSGNLYIMQWHRCKIAGDKKSNPSDEMHEYMVAGLERSTSNSDMPLLSYSQTTTTMKRFRVLSTLLIITISSDSSQSMLSVIVWSTHFFFYNRVSLVHDQVCSPVKFTNKDGFTQRKVDDRSLGEGLLNYFVQVMGDSCDRVVD